MASERNALQNYIDIMTENEFKQWWLLQRTKWSRDRSLSLERKSKSRTLKNKGELVMKEAAAMGVSLRIINRAIESISGRAIESISGKSEEKKKKIRNRAAKKIHKKIDEFENELLKRVTREPNFFRWTGFMNMKVGGEDDEYGRWRRNDGGRYFYKSDVKRAGVFNGNVTIKSFDYIGNAVPTAKPVTIAANALLTATAVTISPANKVSTSPVRGWEFPWDFYTPHPTPNALPTATPVTIAPANTPTIAALNSRSRTIIGDYMPMPDAEVTPLT